MIQALKFQFIALCICLPLIGCVTSSPSPTPTPAAPTKVPVTDISLTPLQLANLAIARAAEQLSPLREASLLDAVDALLEAAVVERATVIFAQIDAGAVPPTLVTRYTLSKSDLLLSQRRPNDALAQLANLQEDSISLTEQKRLYRIRANAYERLGHHLEVARNRVSLYRFLNEDTERENNHAAIWQALTNLNDNALIDLNLAGPPDVLSGWMQLAYLSKRASVQPDLFPDQLRAWRSNYPQHPVSDEFITSLLQNIQTPLLVPGKIAVLLPSSGRFVKAADAIRQGLLAAYFANQSTDKSPLRFYSANSDNVVDAYRQAINEGAELIIGPLEKSAIQTLITNTTLTAPTLALNYVETAGELPENLYQFGLSPENEARQVADHIWQQGYSRGVALYPEGDWGTRVYTAFLQRWNELGGEILETQTYQSQGKDFATPVKTLLNVDESEQRMKSLRRLAGTELGFESRRRQDAEFVFMSGFARQARQLRPQLRFYNASRLPVFATSHVFSGVTNRNLDRDMDGIVFGDMPWTLSDISDASQQSYQNSIRQLAPDTYRSYFRLYAFAIDVYQLVPRLVKLANYGYERLSGLTGTLRIDTNRQVQRELSWARFARGIPKSIEQVQFGPAQVLPARSDELSQAQP